MNARLALGAVSLLLGLCLMELAVRWLDLPPRPLEPLPIRNYQLSDNPLMRYEYRPNYQPTDPPYDFMHRGYRTNSAGFRDRERSVSKPAGVYRILLIGDSTLVGNGVRDSERLFASLLEVRLNGGSRAPVEVLNMGVGGYHTVQEVALLEERGLAYSPNLVMLGVTLNDLDLASDAGVYQWLLKANPGVEPQRGRGLYARSLAQSRLLFVLHHRLRGWLGRQGAPLGRDAHDRWYEENVLRGGSTLEVGFEMLARLRASHGFEVLVFVLPAFSDPFSRYRHGDFHTLVEEVAKRFDFRVLDLIPGFQALNDDASLFALDAMHLNERGHAALAEILAREVGPKVR